MEYQLPSFCHFVYNALVPNIERRYTLFYAMLTKIKVDTIGGDGYPKAGEYKGLQNRNITIIGSRYDAHKKKIIDRHCVTFENDEDFFLMNMTRYEALQKDETGRHVNCLGIIHEDFLKNGS